MDPPCKGLVTKDMIPDVWYLTEEQERTWLQHAATGLPGQTAESLQRIVAIELPDFPMAYDIKGNTKQPLTSAKI